MHLAELASISVVSKPLCVLIFVVCRLSVPNPQIHLPTLLPLEHAVNPIARMSAIAPGLGKLSVLRREQIVGSAGVVNEFEAVGNCCWILWRLHTLRGGCRWNG